MQCDSVHTFGNKLHLCTLRFSVKLPARGNNCIRSIWRYLVPVLIARCYHVPLLSSVSRFAKIVRYNEVIVSKMTSRHSIIMFP